MLLNSSDVTSPTIQNTVVNVREAEEKMKMQSEILDTPEITRNLWNLIIHQKLDENLVVFRNLEKINGNYFSHLLH